MQPVTGNNQESACGRQYRGAAGMLATALALAVCAATCGAQNPNATGFQQNNRRRANRVAAGQKAPGLRRGAVALLHKMVRPLVDYSGEMVTELTTGGAVPYHQTVKGDTNGRRRIEFLSPPNLAGDVLLVGPAQVRNYHHATGVMDVALWPTEWDDHEKRVFEAIRSGAYKAQIVGQETVAERSATIVQVSPTGRAESPSGPQAKYWIDPDTGITLKIERSDAAGRLLSRSYLTSVVIGAAAGVSQADFETKSLHPARINPLFPNPQFHTLQEAQGRLPFQPLVPANLPSAFALSGVWVFPDNAKTRSGFVLLRYSDEVNNFSLYERTVPPNAKPERANQRLFQQHIQHWRVPGNGGEIDVTYIGPLTPNQARTVHDSLH